MTSVMFAGDIPRFSPTPGISKLSEGVDELLRIIGDRDLEGIRGPLERGAREGGIHSSLAIEGNTRDILTVGDLIDGRPVDGPLDEIVEVGNAVAAYGRIGTVDVHSLDDLPSVHDDLMFGLVEREGFRDHGVGVYGGDRVLYRAPSHELVPELMRGLFGWFDGTGPGPCVSAAIMHYYIEKIHPFPDGNGRIGRLWHTAVLSDHDPVFCTVPLERGFLLRRDDYYGALEGPFEGHDPTGFVELSLEITRDSLADLLGAIDRA
ncbi:MAG: Fic family protein [Candidatus Methanomethylophilaceae archaeon]|nr:Fic family protein [Candidatus Methanomethylophilaceae archaeon]